MSKLTCKDLDCQERHRRWSYCMEESDNRWKNLMEESDLRWKNRLVECEKRWRDRLSESETYWKHELEMVRDKRYWYRQGNDEDKNESQVGSVDGSEEQLWDEESQKERPLWDEEKVRTILLELQAGNGGDKVYNFSFSRKRD